MEPKEFSSTLIKWYKQHKRDLPWRHISDPYKIWLSEVILQQTRVDQGMDYYHKFVKHFPTVKHLAKAREDEVLKLWQGLGYYSRARNLHHTAKLVVAEYKGIFPVTYNELIKLKGIGTYTASAISSFCNNEAQAVVDGNVYRVLSRIFGVEAAIDSTLGKKEFAILAAELLNKKDPATHNQAIMEFGAIQCKPKNPDCNACPLQNKCFALAHGRINELPVKSKSTKVSTRYFEYFLFHYKQSLYIKKRTENDIWKNLFDFPLLESEKAFSEEEVLKSPQFKAYTKGNKYIVKSISAIVKHILSHQHIYARFWIIDLKQDLLIKNDWKKIKLNDLDKYAWPRLIDKFLNDEAKKQEDK